MCDMASISAVSGIRPPDTPARQPIARLPVAKDTVEISEAGLLLSRNQIKSIKTVSGVGKALLNLLSLIRL
jgi:hypothetical protein